MMSEQINENLEQEAKRRLLGKRDLIIIALVLFAAGLLFAVLKITETPGKVAVVYVDGEVITKLPLDTDTEYVLENDYGKNIIKVEDGKVSVIEADCPRHICVKTGEKDKVGDTIVCLAHKLVVEVQDEE